MKPWLKDNQFLSSEVIMFDEKTLIQQLVQQHAQVNEKGFAQSYLSGVQVVSAHKHQHRAPMMYPQGLICLFQGHKVGSIGGRSFHNTPEHCLLLTTAYPLECETFASPDEPLMGLYLSLDALMISELVDQIREHKGADYFAGDHSPGVEVIDRDARLSRSLHSLLSALQTPMDSALLGPQCLREVFYLLLTGPQRHILADFCQQDQTLSRVVRVIEHIQAHCDEKLTVESLASLADMSVSAFHRAFKATVEDSPLQYLKKVRLNKAKSLMLHRGMAANAAALAVGYESATPFSREFKRYFGVTPGKAAQVTGQA